MHMHCNVYKHNDIITNITLCIHKLRNAQSLNYGPSLSPLLKKDNLHIKDKMPAPDLSVIRRFHCIISETFAYAKSISHTNLTESDFIKSDSDYYFRVLFTRAQNLLQKPINELNSTLVEDLRHHLPHRTPSTGDKIMYTIVEEAMTAM